MKPVKPPRINGRVPVLSAQEAGDAANLLI